MQGKSNKMETYVGLKKDLNGGMTHLGQMVRDAWVFGLIPDSEDCANWNASQRQVLYDKICAEWEQYASLPSLLPPELKQRHEKIYMEAIRHAKANGWNPELGDDV